MRVVGIRLGFDTTVCSTPTPTNATYTIAFVWLLAPGVPHLPQNTVVSEQTEMATRRTIPWRTYENQSYCKRNTVAFRRFWVNRAPSFAKTKPAYKMLSLSLK